MAKKEKSVKSKCCGKFIKKDKHCSKCPIADDCALKLRVEKKKKKEKKDKKDKKDKKKK